MELNDYLRILRNHWLGVVVIVVTCVGLAGIYSLTQPKLYAANAAGFVSAGGTATDPALSSVSDSLAKSRAKSYVDIAKSRATAQTVITELGLNTSPAELIGQISAEQPSDTVLIKITAKAGSPREAQALADAWVRALQVQIDEVENPSGKNEAAIRLIPQESAALPSSPVSPRVELNLAIGFGVGLLLGFAYALVRSQLDRRIRSAGAVEKEFGVSVVGQIPKANVLKHEVGARAELAVITGTARGNDQSAAEAFRKLRTNLQFMSVDNPPRIIVVTSSKPGDGKSTVTANLAAAIAASGSAVILLDGDLRRPTVATSFGLGGCWPHRRVDWPRQRRRRTPTTQRTARPSGDGRRRHPAEPQRTTRLANHGPVVEEVERTRHRARGRSPTVTCHRRRRPHGHV